MKNDQDIKKIIIGLSSGNPSNLSDILYGSQRYPSTGSEEDNKIRILEQQLIEEGLVDVTEVGGTNNTINGYYYFVISPKGLKWLQENNQRKATIRPLHALSTNENDVNLTSKGLINRGLLGFIDAEQTSETVELQGYYLTFPKGDDYFYTADSSKERMQGRSPVGLPPLGFVRKDSHSDFIRLHRFFSDTHHVHLFVTNPNKEILDKEFQRDESKGHPIFVKERKLNNELPLYLYSTSNAKFFTPISEKAVSPPSRSFEVSQQLLEQLWLDEISNMLIWDLSLQQGKNSYVDIKQFLNLYNLELRDADLLSVIDKLREDRYVYQDQSDPFKVMITNNGQKYVDTKIKPRTQKSRDFDESTILSILTRNLNSDDFRIEISKDFVQVNFFPNGKSSDFTFLAQRINGLYYRLKANPKVNLFTRSDLDAILRALDIWASEVKRLSTQPKETDSKPKSIGKNDVFNRFVVGSSWSDGDHTNQFFKDNVWENGYDTDYLDIVKSVAINDILVLKSSFSRSGKSYLRVKGLGRVKTNPSDGKKLSVDWWYKGPPIDIENLGFYRSTIQKLRSQDWEIIENHINRDNSKNDNVSLQHDALSEVDLLGRDPFIQALKDYIQTLSATQGSNPYMIHLDGEWGSGKSNSLKFLNKKLTETKEWLIIEYNAWENQHMEPPWWNFMNTVYKSIRTQTPNWIKKGWISLREFYWRFFSINKANVFITISLIILGGLLIWKGNFLIELVEKDKSNRIGDTVDIIVGLTSLLGTGWLLFQWIRGSLLTSSSEAVLHFKKTASDPMVKIKNHFSDIIGYTPKNVAIFIDDIDRCGSGTVVKLLEGIQTLFKSNKIVYVVTGDGSWIKQCFECHYSEFTSTVSKPGNSLGNLFQEKLFQMSITLPRLTPTTMDSFLRSLLTDPNSTTDKSASTEKLEELRSEVAKTIGQKEENIQKVIDQYKETENEYLAVKIAVEEMSKKMTFIELEHRLQPYSSYLPPNARSIKRFINNYALRRQALIIQGVSFNEVDFDKLVRWQILTAKYPKIADLIIENPSFMKQANHEIFKDNDFIALINGLDERTIKLILGRS
jgi:hypothetical protein